MKLSNLLRKKSSGLLSLGLVSMGLWVAVTPATAQMKELKPLRITAQTPDNTNLQTRAMGIIELLNKNQYTKVRDLLSPELGKEISAEEIGQIWQNLVATTGAITKQVNSKVINTIEADLVLVNVDFEKTNGQFIVTFDKQGQIVGIDFPKIDSIDKIAQIFVKSLVENDFPRARGYLHPFLKSEIFPEQVEKQWNNLIKEYGPVENILATEVRTGSSVDHTDVVTVTVQFEKLTTDLFIIFDDDKRIVGVDLPESD